MPHRRQIILGLAAAGLLAPVAARAHHGWDWAEDEEFTLTGRHPRRPPRQPARRARRRGRRRPLDRRDRPALPQRAAGLTEALLAPGTEVTLEGHRSRDPDERLMKAERIIIAGKLYDLYPDRT